MSRPKTDFTTVAYLVVGAIAGGIAGIAVACGVALHVMNANPNDPSAGSVAGGVGMLTFPVGLFAGCCIGLVLCQLRRGKRHIPKGFDVITRRAEGKDSTR